ncbi:MAG: acyltransferase, partial [Bacteroidetes bacterium]|nr:acyltransferase [Bacteroidota bacterium]
MSDKTVHFKNLNGLRAIAAMMVLLHHWSYRFPQFQSNIYIGDLLINIGKSGVVLFFVLSGFLITYLLLFELKKCGKIDKKKFYMRRILRIWPLYFLIIFLGMFIIPNVIYLRPVGYLEIVQDDFFIKLFLFVFMLPNVVYSFFPNMAILSMSWSIGVEEQFYLMWPGLLNTSKNILRTLIWVIIIYTIVKIIIASLHHFYPNQIMDRIRFFWTFFLIDCMAIGAIIGFFVFTKKNKLHFLIGRYQLIISSLLLILLLISNFKFGIFHFQIQGILYALIIYNLTNKNKPYKILENKIMNEIGKISFGVYMYHLIIIEVVL